MKSVRTVIPSHQEIEFRSFLNVAGLEEVKIGKYDNIRDNYYVTLCLCYLYSEKSTKTVATLTYILLKYGNIDAAYNSFNNALYASLTTDPYFNWTP